MAYIIILLILFFLLYFSLLFESKNESEFCTSHTSILPLNCSITRVGMITYLLKMPLEDKFLLGIIIFYWYILSLVRFAIFFGLSSFGATKRYLICVNFPDFTHVYILRKRQEKITQGRFTTLSLIEMAILHSPFELSLEYEKY